MRSKKVLCHFLEYHNGDLFNNSIVIYDLTNKTGWTLDLTTHYGQQDYGVKFRHFTHFHSLKSIKDTKKLKILDKWEE